MNAVVARAGAVDAGGDVAGLWEAIDPGFLAVLGWDPQLRLLFFPADHPLLGAPVCRVGGCAQISMTRGLCSGCRLRWGQLGQPPMQEFVTMGRGQWRQSGVADCSVTGCPRPARSWRRPLCTTHLGQFQRHGLALEDFLARDDVVALPPWGACEVASCHRSRGGRAPYCHAHRVRWQHGLHRGLLSPPDEPRWRRTAAPVAANNDVSLRGLPDQLAAELLYGVQARTGEGFHTFHAQLRNLVNRLREMEVACLAAVDRDRLERSTRGLYGSLADLVGRRGLTPEGERAKDVWNGAVFGHKGHLRFARIRQPWLREAAKELAFFSLPQRRGAAVKSMQDIVNAFALLSESLHLQREDHGVNRHLLSRSDVTAFTNRLAYLHHTGALSAHAWVTVCRHVRGNLAKMRSIGLARPGGPLHGLPEDFAFLAEDVPDDPEDSEAGKDLPAEVMRRLCEHLPRLAEGLHGREQRVAVELLIDTGRRPHEICALRWDCLRQDPDGQHVLIYDNHKANRVGRRLPISRASAAVITAQQDAVRADYPNTPVAELVLLPTRVANPYGRKHIGSRALSSRHRVWVDSLPEILVPTLVEIDGQPVTQLRPFDKSAIFLYAYRSTYCQRHADAGVPVDVLRLLMDHRRMDTTQAYYRVSDKRKREAVDRVTAMQFDRHGNQIWRHAQQLLDSEHARRAVGEVTVPYGVCTEPSNVAAAGQDCPVRFRCVGCGHFRTDASYLPDLKAYLADLLRNRERLAAAVDADDWAKAEARPSDEEIRRVRRLIDRVEAGLQDLDAEQRAQIDAAIAVVRRGRQGVLLGLPRVRQPLPDLRPERPEPR